MSKKEEMQSAEHHEADAENGGQEVQEPKGPVDRELLRKFPQYLDKELRVEAVESIKVLKEVAKAFRRRGCKFWYDHTFENTMWYVNAVETHLDKSIGTKPNRDMPAPDSLWEPVLDNVRAAILACDMRTPRTAAHMPATPARSDRAERAEPGWIDSCV